VLFALATTCSAFCACNHMFPSLCSCMVLPHYHMPCLCAWEAVVCAASLCTGDCVCRPVTGSSPGCGLRSASSAICSLHFDSLARLWLANTLLEFFTADHLHMMTFMVSTHSNPRTAHSLCTGKRSGSCIISCILLVQGICAYHLGEVHERVWAHHV
jgi:hypothetical protein